MLWCRRAFQAWRFWLDLRRWRGSPLDAPPHMGSGLRLIWLRRWLRGSTAGLFVCFTLPGALYFYATVAMLVGLAIGAMYRASRSTTPNSTRL